MTDLARHVALAGESLIARVEGTPALDVLLAWWLKPHAPSKTVLLVVPDVTTAFEENGYHSIEADLVAVAGDARSGIRILISAYPENGGWTIDHVDVHAPTSIAVADAEKALDQVLDEDADHPLAATVEGIVDGMSNEAFAAACDGADEGSFRRITGWNVRDVDALWIRADPSTFRGSADAWTMEVRLGVDSDCGQRDHDLTISGACTLGVTRFTSVVVA